MEQYGQAIEAGDFFPEEVPEQIEGKPWDVSLVLNSRYTWDMDEDLDLFTKEQLIAEVKRLRAGIREHRDSTKHELCWHHPQLWSLLPEMVDPEIAVPAWPQFLRGCLRYRESLDQQLPNAPRVTDDFDESRKEGARATFRDPADDVHV